MNRQQKRQKFSAGEVELAQLKAVDYGRDLAVERILPAILLVLHDKYKFGHKRCNDFLNYVQKQAECINSGYVTAKEMKESVKEEILIEITKAAKKS